MKEIELNLLRERKKKRGFLLTGTSLIILVLLFAISAVLANYVYQALRTEAFFTHRTQRSLYPIAWSTTYFVLETLSGDIDPITHRIHGANNMFVSNDKIYSSDIFLTSTIPGSGDMPDTPIHLKIRMTSSPKVPIWVTVTAAYTGTFASDDMQSTVVGGIVSNDAGTAIKLQWRND